MNSKKAQKTEDFDKLQERVFREHPEVRQVWQKTELKRQVAALLMGIRKFAGLSQKEIADREEWDKSFVCRLEGASGGVPDLNTIARYVRACEVGASVGLVIGVQESPERMHIFDAITLHDEPDQESTNPFGQLRDHELGLALQKNRLAAGK